MNPKNLIFYLLFITIIAGLLFAVTLLLLAEFNYF